MLWHGGTSVSSVTQNIMTSTNIHFTTCISAFVCFLTKLIEEMQKVIDLSLVQLWWVAVLSNAYCKRKVKSWSDLLLQGITEPDLKITTHLYYCHLCFQGSKCILVISGSCQELFDLLTYHENQSQMTVLSIIFIFRDPKWAESNDIYFGCRPVQHLHEQWECC